MARTPMEEGAYRAGRAVEATRRHGLPKEVILDYYLAGEGCGIQGALNAAVNTYGEHAPYEIKEHFVLGWVTTLLRLTCGVRPSGDPELRDQSQARAT